MQQQKITEDDMARAFARVQKAVRTLRMLPAPVARGRMTAWPEVVQEFWTAYGYTDPAPPRLVPTAPQITTMDEVIADLAWLTREAGPDLTRIVWAKAERYSYRRIGRMCGVSDKTAKARLMEAVYLLADRAAKK